MSGDVLLLRMKQIYFITEIRFFIIVKLFAFESGNTVGEQYFVFADTFVITCKRKDLLEVSFTFAKGQMALAGS